MTVLLELIKQLLAAFGPLLVELIRAWLESALKRAAKKVPAADTFPSPAAAAVALVEQAIVETPRLAFGKRALLRSIRANAGSVVSGFPLSDAARGEIQDAGKGAQRD